MFDVSYLFIAQELQHLCLFLCVKVIDLNDGFLELLNENGSLREDLRLPDNDIGKEIVLRLKNEEKFFVRPPDLIKHTCIAI